jgi:hypothetical protein
MPTLTRRGDRTSGSVQRTERQVIDVVFGCHGDRLSSESVYGLPARRAKKGDGPLLDL